MMIGLTIANSPTSEPLTLDQVKQHLRVDGTFTDDDSYLSSLISVARSYVENYTRRALLPQSWVLTLDHFPCKYLSNTLNPSASADFPFYPSLGVGNTIALPKPRCISVDSITYLSTATNTVTVSPTAYYLDSASEPARIVPSAGTYWPYTQQYLPGSITVKYTCGTYTDAAQIPAPISLAMLLLIGEWYEHREASTGYTLAQLHYGVAALLDPYVFGIVSYGDVR